MTQFLKKFYRYEYTIVLILIFVNIVIVQFPLTNLLSYEFSAINGIILFHFSGLHYLLSEKWQKRHTNRSLVLFNSFIFFIPFVIAALSNFVFSICPLADGIPYYLLISAPSQILGFAISVFIVRLSSKFRIILFNIVFLPLILIPLYEIYTLPQIYFYNALIGFFPGTMYDENIPLDQKFIAYRSMITLFAILVFTLYRISFKLRDELSKILLTTILVSLLLVYWNSSEELGLTTTIDSIKSELKGETITDHFIILYPDSLKSNEIEYLKLNHEFYYSKLSHTTGLSTLNKITSIVFKNKLQKGRLFGAYRADVAKPWLHQIYLDIDNYESTLKHELAHIFMGEVSDNMLHVAVGINPSLIEGFATALENNYDDNDVHYSAFLARNKNYKVELPELFSGFSFLAQTPSLAYIYSGSFIKYLIDNYGFSLTSNLYANLDFEQHFGKSITELAGEYEKFLDGLDYNFNEFGAQLYFGRKPIFKRTCVRATAKNLNASWEQFYAGAYSESQKTFENIYNYSDAYSALMGQILSFEKMKDYNLAQDLLKREIVKYENSSYLFNLELKRIDLSVRVDDIEKAKILIDKFLDKSPNYNYTNAALIRKKYLEKENFEFWSESDSLKYESIIALNKDTFDMEFFELFYTLGKRNNYSPDYLYKILDRYDGKLIYSSEGVAELNISRNALRNGRYDLAENFAHHAVELNTRNYRKTIFNENLDKVVWFRNFSN